MKPYQQHNILFIPIANAQFSVVRVFFKAGSCFDPIHKSGLAHITEHLVQPTPSSYFVAEAATFKEHMVFSSTQFPRDAAKAVEMIFSGITRSFTDEEFHHEHTVIQNELENNPPSTELATAMSQLFGDDTPLQSAIAGTLTSIPSITPDDVRDFVQRNLVTEKCSIVVSGNFNADDVVAAVSRCGYRHEHTIPTPHQTRLPTSGIVLHNDHESLCNTQLYWAAPSVYDFSLRTRYMIARAVIGEYADSLVPEILRKECAVYDTEIISEYYSAAAFTCFGYYVDTLAREHAVDTIRTQITDASNLVTQDMLDAIKQRVILEIVKVQNDPEALTWWYGEDFSYCGQIFSIENDLIPQIHALTAAEVVTTIHAWFQV